MAKQLKTEIHVNESLGSDITLDLTQDQTSILLDKIMAGATAHINLRTPTANGHKVKEDPAAYSA